MASLFSSVSMTTESEKLSFCTGKLFSGVDDIRANEEAAEFLTNNAGERVIVDVLVYQATCDDEKMHSMIRKNPETLKAHSLPYGCGSFSFTI